MDWAGSAERWVGYGAAASAVNVPDEIDHGAPPTPGGQSLSGFSAAVVPARAYDTGSEEALWPTMQASNKNELKTVAIAQLWRLRGPGMSPQR